MKKYIKKAPVDYMGAFTLSSLYYIYSKGLSISIFKPFLCLKMVCQLIKRHTNSNHRTRSTI